MSAHTHITPLPPTLAYYAAQLYAPGTRDDAPADILAAERGRAEQLLQDDLAALRVAADKLDGLDSIRLRSIARALKRLA